MKCWQWSRPYREPDLIQTSAFSPLFPWRQKHTVVKCHWMRWRDKKASVFQRRVARTQVSPSSSWSFRSTQPLSPTMHHKRVSQWSSTCRLYLQDRIPDILVAFAWCWADRQQIPPAWKPPRRYKVPMVSTGQFQRFQAIKSACFALNYR